MSNDFLFSLLPFDIIREILLYDTHFIIRKQNNRIICINKIPKTDKRFLLFKNIPKVYEISKNSWSVILGLCKRYVICHSLKPSQLWQYSISIFSKDQITNMMNWFADSEIRFL
jgi:hypothetical protein